jgi:hypothetical protein
MILLHKYDGILHFVHLYPTQADTECSHFSYGSLIANVHAVGQIWTP